MPKQGGGGSGGGAARASALPRFFDVDWRQPASQDGQTAVVQENIGDANLDLMQYGLHESCLVTSGAPGSARLGPRPGLDRSGGDPGRGGRSRPVV